MTLGVELDGTPVSASRIIIGGTAAVSVSGLPMSADGTGSQGGITFDDPDGSYTHRGWSIAKVDESDSTAAPTLFYGTTGPRTESRGTYRDGPGRVIDTTLNDSNVFLSLRIIGGDTGSRPEETDTARVAWLLADASLDGLVADLGFVNTTGLTLDPLYTQGMTPGEVLSDIASHYGQIFFTYWDQTAEAVGLFFDFADATTFTCDLSISNVMSDITLDANEVVTGDVYPPLVDGVLDITPEDVYSRVRFKYTGGVVWRSRPATAAEFFPEPLRYGSVQVENDRIGKLTTATTFADRFLTAHSQERVTVKFTVRLPATRVGEIQAGMRISLRFSHLTGFDTATWTRIEVINRVPVDVYPPAYDVTCTCSTAGIKSGYGSGGGSTDPFPYVPPSSDVTVIQQVSGESNLHLPNPVGTSTTLIWAAAQRGGDILGAWDYLADGYTLCPDGETVEPVGTNTVVIIYKHTDGTQGQDLGSTGAITGVNGTFYEVSGLLTPAQNSEGLTNGSFTLSSGSITAAAGFIVGVSAQGVGGGYDSVANLVSYTLGAGWTEDYDHFTTGGHPTVTNGHRFDAGTYAYTATNDLPSGDAGIAQVVSFIGSGTLPDPPQPGKPWGPVLPNETPNGTTTSFTMPTGYTWAENSLRVFVDRLDQTAAVTAEDGTAGTFTLGFAPKTGELVEVYGTAI